MNALVACAVCFGQSDSPMAWGTNMGIFLMLGVTAAVLTGFASFFIYLIRRARMFELTQRSTRNLQNSQSVFSADSAGSALYVVEPPPGAQETA